MKAVVLNNKQWGLILEKLRRTQKPSTLLVRSKMKDELGFTPRDHTNFDKATNSYNREIHIDFYNENARTMFLLKYSEEITS